MIKVSENIGYIPSSGLFVYTKRSGRCKVGSHAGQLCQVTKKSGGISYIKVVINGKREFAHRVGLVVANDLLRSPMADGSHPVS